MEVYMENEMIWNEEIDVLVVGTGFAGLTAAIEASEMGKHVIIIEKMKSAGGNSIISDGGIAAPATAIQHKYSINDSEQLMYDDMIKAGLGFNHPNLLKTMVKNARIAFEWTIETLNISYMDRVDVFGGHSVPRCYTPEGKTGAAIINKMLLKASELGIVILYSTSLQFLIKNKYGQVEGAKVLKNYDYKSHGGTPYSIKANRGIVLAAGGYGADVSFRSIQDPRLDESIETTNKPFATSEVLKSALSIGAASVQLSQIQLGAWASPDEKGFGDGPLFADYILFQYGIIVDKKTGKRFVNELGDRKMTSDAILKVGHPCIGIADYGAVERSGWDLSKAIKKDVVKKFKTIFDLASYYGIDEAILIDEISLYNLYVDNGIDEDFNKDIVSDATPIQKAPFYGMRLWPKVHFTMGGISINKKAQVLDYDNNMINGLYAAGEIVGGVHGASRLGSCAITECIVFGRIAGKNV
jgi:flavocytochrome c